LDVLPLFGAEDQNESSMELTNVFCRNLKQFTNDVTKETKYLDNLLKNLHQYYIEIKTRRKECSGRFSPGQTMESGAS